MSKELVERVLRERYSAEIKTSDWYESVADEIEKLNQHIARLERQSRTEARQFSDLFVQADKG